MTLNKALALAVVVGLLGVLTYFFGADVGITIFETGVETVQ